MRHFTLRKSILPGGNHMQEDIFSGLVTQLEERFQEMDSDITTALLDSDEGYAALRRQLGALEQRFPIEKWLEGAGALTLTVEEHAGLVEYMRVTDEAENRERLNLYYAGHRDCFAYLKRIGLL
jgi:hypothetical protein